MSYDELLEEIGKTIRPVIHVDFYPIEVHEKVSLEFAEQVLSKVLSYFASLVGEEELVTEYELNDKQLLLNFGTHHMTDIKRLLEAQAAKSKAIQMARTKCSDVYDRTMKKGGYYDCV